MGTKSEMSFPLGLRLRKIDDDLLVQYMTLFSGYGNFDSNYWMVGMEEGGGDTSEEIERRISIWDAGGRNRLEDLELYHQKVGITLWFGSNAMLQPTWNKLIRIIFSLKGLTPSIEDIRNYQKGMLGKKGGENCLVELMPLPSPSTNQWLYRDISTLPELRSRKGYMAHWGTIRLKLLADQIADKGPKYIVFYGFSYYKDWWSKLMPKNYASISIGGVKAYLGEGNGTVFAVTPHPVATGIRNEFFHELGTAMRAVRRT